MSSQFFSFKILITLLKMTIILCLATYIAFGIYLYLNQFSLTYHTNNQDFYDCPHFTVSQQQQHNGTRFYLMSGSDNNAIVVYHGNADTACNFSFTQKFFTQTNSSIIYVEFNGYANHPGQTNQQTIEQDVRNIDDFVQQQNFDHTLVYGYSIGSAAATYHASIANIDHLILVSPFDNFPELVQSKFPYYPTKLLIKDQYDNAANLTNYQGSLIIFHGQQDPLIPYYFSQQLFDQVSITDKQYYLIPDTAHHDLWQSTEFQTQLNRYLYDKLPS